MFKGRRHSILSHPVCLIGGGLVFFSFFSILSMFLIEAILGKANPYIGVFTYMIYPALLILGLLLIPVGALLERRRRVLEGALPLFPRIDLNEGRTRGIFFSIVAVTVLILALISTVSYRAYQFTDSVIFCGQLCHSVMNPEYTAYQASPHSRVACADCHVGPGATWFVRSKLSGSYQIYSVLSKKFPRPITTPIENLRPARETCEHCHWPEKFFGAQLKVINRFEYDEKNNVRQIQMLIRTGGGSPTTGITTGIHWHMNIANEVWYAATDPQRQKIPWVRVKDMQGRVTEYFDGGAPLSDEQLKKREIRRMDCMDCHNRPSHIFRDPDAAVDNALLTQLVDRTLPYIKREAVRALGQPYPDTETALERIATTLDSFYFTRYPAIYDRRRDTIKKAIGQIQQIYQTNFFPEMKVDWRTHPDNIGHTLYPGCFRCHEGKHISREGKVIRRDCQLCHAIIGQETQVGNPTEVVMAEKFKHPWPFQGKHAEISCTQCHWRGRGLVAECGTCHERPADAPMAFECNQCHLKEQYVKPIQACTTCHTGLGELHLKPTHSAADCTLCHIPHQWKVGEKELCFNCHQDKTAHNPEAACQDCHSFRRGEKKS
ncbi:MAG: cytochrome c3 family protein [Acidobacteria bacterium]|nr:cytochrome c3 family protein [Acidobacteriota bacterium]